MRGGSLLRDWLGIHFHPSQSRPSSPLRGPSPREGRGEGIAWLGLTCASSDCPEVGVRAAWLQGNAESVRCGSSRRLPPLTLPSPKQMPRAYGIVGAIRTAVKDFTICSAAISAVAVSILTKLPGWEKTDDASLLRASDGHEHTLNGDINRE